MAEEKFVCHINGFRLKDTEARKMATTAGQMANAALEKSTTAEKQIAEAVTTANRAKTTAAGANVTAKAAFTTAELAETNANAAADTAAAALPRKGGIMLGDVNMNGNNINGATQIIGKRLGGKLLDLEYIPPNGVNTGEKRGIFRVEPDGRGESLTFSVIPWTGTTYDPTAAEHAVLRGVAPGLTDTDAVNLGQVREMVGNVNGSGQNPTQGGGYYQNYANYKAVFLGDSQTDATVGEPKKWWKWVEELLNIGECVSYGKSGSTLGDMCTRYANMDADANMVFVMGGVNDFKTTVSTPLGTIADTTPDTMYGAVRYLCQKLQAKYPKTPIIFITPTNQSNGFFVHSADVTMADFAKAMNEACRMEGVLCLDAQASLGINPAYDNSYTSDRLHLNYDGNELLGKWVARKVNENVPILSGGEVEPDEPDTEKTLTSISATYSGCSVTAGTAVNDLTDIVVTAHYSDGSSETVTGYTLSGTIAEGSNTVTVGYGGKTTTFTVIGEAVPVEIPSVHNGWAVTKFAELPADISTMYQYPGFIEEKGGYNSNANYHHLGYIACEPGTYSIVPRIGFPVSVYDSNFNWIETKKITTQGTAFNLVLSEFRYVILATQKTNGYTSITKTA
jgi:lysophospholipase L1-like esterase